MRYYVVTRGELVGVIPTHATKSGLRQLTVDMTLEDALVWIVRAGGTSKACNDYRGAE